MEIKVHRYVEKVWALLRMLYSRTKIVSGTASTSSWLEEAPSGGSSWTQSPSGACSIGNLRPGLPTRESQAADSVVEYIDQAFGDRPISNAPAANFGLYLDHSVRGTFRLIHVRLNRNQ